MNPLTQAKLLLLCLVPALAVPRGVVLDWCLCFAETSPCCTSCCGQEGPPGASDCPACKSIEVDDFDEFLTGNVPQLPTFKQIAALPAPSAVPESVTGARSMSARAPPPPVLPPGLRPGAAPLRL